MSKNYTSDSDQTFAHKLLLNAWVADNFTSTDIAYLSTVVWYNMYQIAKKWWVHGLAILTVSNGLQLFTWKPKVKYW